MADIVETIQAEQDHVIRAPHGGVLVVQGGAGHRQDRGGAAPGRVPALHVPAAAGEARRARRRAEPDVPALHRRGAAGARRDRGRAGPGVRAVPRRRRGDRPSRKEVAEVKGRAAMADVLATAVKDRQHVPDGALVLHLDGERMPHPGGGDPAGPDRGPAHPPPAQRGPPGVRGAVRRRRRGRVRGRSRRAFRRRPRAGRGRGRARPGPAGRRSSATTTPCWTRWTSCGRA